MLELSEEKVYDIRKVYGKDKKSGEDFYNKWLREYPILKNEDVQKWIRNKINQFTDEGKNPKGFKITTYLRPLYQYCLFNKVENPTDLLDEVNMTVEINGKKGDIENGNLRLKTYINFLLDVIKDKNNKQKLQKLKDLKFRVMKNTGKVKIPNEVSVRNMIQGRIRSFYSSRGFQLSVKIKTKDSGKNVNEIDVDKEMIKRIKNNINNITYNLVCKFQTQTGLRINDILKELTNGKYVIENYKDGDFERYFIRNFETQKEKVVINFMPFTNELADMLSLTYPEIKDDLTKLDLSNLFITRNNKRIREVDYLDRLKLATKRAGIKGNMKTHLLRKYYITQIEDVKEISSKFRDHLEGHTTDYSDKTYNKNIRRIKWFFDNWKLIEESICVNGVIYGKTDKKVIKLDKRYKDIMEQLVETNKTNTELQNKLNSMEHKVEGFDQLFRILLEKQRYSEEIDEKHGIESTKVYKVMKKVFEEHFEKLSKK